jgi:GNAT superfamily N-acetyltransferase
MSHRIEPARSPADLVTIRELFREYAQGLGVDLEFQGFAAELATLPGKYAPPGGELLLARDVSGAALGCVGLRPLPIEGACEMKRLYVRERARGTGSGRALAVAILDLAVTAGYREIRLDTLAFMGPATTLYRALGFAPIPRYSDNVVPGILFFGKRLKGGS